MLISKKISIKTWTVRLEASGLAANEAHQVGAISFDHFATQALAAFALIQFDSGCIGICFLVVRTRVVFLVFVCVNVSFMIFLKNSTSCVQ